MKRYLEETIRQFAQEKMVFICGPRQVGKTTIAEHWLRSIHGRYLNWDISEDRAQILKPSFASELNTPGIVLDELHKYHRWKSLLKGLYDKRKRDIEILVTGSARLDIYQKSGDSLLGRYELLHLHPLTIGELSHGHFVPPPTDWLSVEPQTTSTSRIWEQLKRRSGFPEPFFKDDDFHQKRWSLRRKDLIIKEDLRDLSQIKMLSLVEQLAILLPLRAGSSLSLNSLSEELQVSHPTIKNWVDMLERLFYCFRIFPYKKNIARSLKKEPKLYLWDFAEVKDPGHQFENMIACHLLKSVQAWTDFGFGYFELMYLRDEKQREVDFVICKDREPVVFIECKLNDSRLSNSLLYFGEMFPNIPLIQLLETPKVDIRSKRSRIISADSYLSALL